MAPYKDWVKSLEPTAPIDTWLMKDLKTCAYDDPRLFTFLIPDIYEHVSNSLLAY